MQRSPGFAGGTDEMGDKAMGGHRDLGAVTLVAFGHYYEVTQSDLGQDAHLRKRGLTFDVEAGQIEGVGHYSVLRMRAPTGLMRMETLVIAPTEVDAPLLNLDWVNALGTETLIAEFYDDQLTPLPIVCQEELARVCKGAASLPEALRRGRTGGRLRQAGLWR